MVVPSSSELRLPLQMMLLIPHRMSQMTAALSLLPCSDARLSLWLDLRTPPDCPPPWTDPAALLLPAAWFDLWTLDAPRLLHRWTWDLLNGLCLSLWMDPRMFHLPDCPPPWTNSVALLPPAPWLDPWTLDASRLQPRMRGWTPENPMDGFCLPPWTDPSRITADHLKPPDRTPLWTLQSLDP